MNKFDNDPEWRRFEREIRKNLIPKMVNSASVLMIAPGVSTTTSRSRSRACTHKGAESRLLVAKQKSSAQSEHCRFW
jgi:hypothetical protein